MCPRPLLPFCACKTVWLASELLVSMGPSPYLWLLKQNYKSLCPRPHLSFCAWKTAWFSQEWQVHMGSSPHLSFLFFFIQNSDFGTRLTSLYGSQTSSVVMSTHNSVLSPRIKRLYGFQPSHVVLCMQISDFSTWITSLCWSQLSSVVFACKTATFVRAYKSLGVPDLNCRFVHAKQRA